MSALKSDDVANVMVAKLIFLGPSMQGKTVTRQRLTNAIKSISREAIKNLSSEAINNIEAIKNISSKAIKNISSEAIKNISSEAIKNISSEATKNISSEAINNISSEAIKNISREAIKNISSEAIMNISSEAIKNILSEAIKNICEVIKNISSEAIKNIPSDAIRNMSSEAIKNISSEAITNISSSSFDKSNTGVSEQSTVIICKDMLHATAIAKDDSDWMPIDIDIEEESLFGLNVSQETQVISHTEHAVSVPVVKHSPNPQHVKEMFAPEEPCCSSTFTNTQHSDQVSYEKEDAHPTSAEISAVSVGWSKNVLSDPKFRKKNYYDSLKKKLNKGCLLYMQDTGGQPELMECLPVLTIGPALYLLFCKLNSRLDDKYSIGYRGPDGTPLPIQSHFTVKETLLSALASIASMGYSSTDQVTDIEQQLDNKRGCVYLIGTHRDKVTTNMEAIDQFESDFQETLLSTFFYKEDLIKWWKEDDFPPNIAFSNNGITQRLVYPLDNKFGEDTEMDYLRSSIHKRLNKLCANKKKIPTTWIFFGICLRRKKESKISLESCFKLGRDLNMTEKTTRAVLHFLHYDIGICMHFSNIPALRNIVIPNTQSIYKNLTMLIEVAFKPSKVGKAAADSFKKTGQFSIEEFQGASDYTLPLNIVVEILKHLNIVAPVPSKIVEKTVFFMPCVLQNASDEEITKFQKENPMPLVLSPLFVRYECGFVPLGVFSSMIANLMQKASQSVSCILTIVCFWVQYNALLFLYYQINILVFL